MPTRLPVLAPLSPAQIELAERTFALASDKTRLSIMSLLVESELHVTSLCERLGMSQPSVSHHVALAKLGGILESRREGKHNFYSLTANGRKLVKLAAGLGE